MEIDLQRLKTARQVLVRLVKERHDGKKYVPLVLKIESEIQALDQQTDHYRRLLSEAA